MHIRPHRHIPLLLLLSALPCAAQTYLDLDFRNNVEATNAQFPNNSSLGPNYYSGQTMHFTNVTSQNGVSVDAVVTVSAKEGSYDLIGWIPHYNHQWTNRRGDLGAYAAFTGTYPDATSPALGGLTYQISFYVGGESLLPSDRFQTEIALSAFRFLVYDHDGEPSQAESIRTFYEDGFVGYQIRDGSGITTEADASSVIFHSQGSNLSETTDAGSFIAYYENTSSIQFQLLASTTHDAVGPLGGYLNTYGIFTAFDGSLSLINGDTANFGATVPVPEPSAILLLGITATAAFLRRKR